MSYALSVVMPVVVQAGLEEVGHLRATVQLDTAG